MPTLYKNNQPVNTHHQTADTREPVMRAVAADLVYQAMQENEDIVLVFGDLGYRMWDRVRAAFPDRTLNTGAAEQSLIGTSVGLALAGKIPVVYSITPFLLYRPFETIRNYIHHEKIPVKLLGAGRNQDYGHDGFSHWAEEDRQIMAILSNIKSYWPEDNTELTKIMTTMFTDPHPYYLNLRRQ